MEFIKKRWKEIVLGISIIIIFALLFLLINHLLSKKEDALLEQQIAEKNYNDVLSGETSVEILQKRLADILAEKEKMKIELPENYRIQDANADLVEIIKGTKILNIDNCEVVENPIASGAKYKKINIKVKSFYGSYQQVKDFLDFIKEYEGKVVIEDIDFDREDLTNNMKGKNLVLAIYSLV